MQPVDEVHPARDAVEKIGALSRGEHATRRRHPEDQRIRHPTGVTDRGRQIGDDRNPVRDAVKHDTGIRPRTRAVDHAEDPILLGVADEPVGGLAVLPPEVAFAVDDGGG